MENSVTLSTITGDSYTLKVSNSLPDKHLRETPVHVYQNTQIRMFTAKLFIIVPNWK